MIVVIWLLWSSSSGLYLFSPTLSLALLVSLTGIMSRLVHNSSSMIALVVNPVDSVTGGRPIQASLPMTCQGAEQLVNQWKQKVKNSYVIGADLGNCKVSLSAWKVILAFLKPHAETIVSLMMDFVFSGIKDEGEAAELLTMISDTFQHSPLGRVVASRNTEYPKQLFLLRPLLAKPTLTGLDVQDGNLGVEEFRLLQECLIHGSLKELSIAKNHGGDRCAPFLAAIIRQNPSLVQLSAHTL